MIAGGGHNALVAATLLARAGRSVAVLERRGELGGAAVSAAPFPGFDVRLSRYSYLVSLFPPALLRTLGVSIEIRARRVAAYPPLEQHAAFQAMLANVARADLPHAHRAAALARGHAPAPRRRRRLERAVRGTAVGAARANVRLRSDARHGPHRRADRDVRAGRRPAAPPEPLLPVPRRRRQLERAGRRHGRAVGRARGGRPRGRRAARDRGGGDRDRDRRSDRRGDLRRRAAPTPPGTCSPASPRPC